jgi:hypothetical protein
MPRHLASVPTPRTGDLNVVDEHASGDTIAVGWTVASSVAHHGRMSAPHTSRPRCATRAHFTP